MLVLLLLVLAIVTATVLVASPRQGPPEGKVCRAVHRLVRWEATVMTMKSNMCLSWYSLMLSPTQVWPMPVRHWGEMMTTMTMTTVAV